MIDLKKYIDDEDMIKLYNNNFNMDDFAEFISYMNASGLNKNDIGELLLNYVLFTHYWQRWCDLHDF